MATRRAVPASFEEKTPTLPSSSTDRILTPSQQAAEATVKTPSVPAPVIYKLLFFTLAMVVGPIGMYFFTLNSIYGGNSTWAGATAAVTANVVLLGYIVVAIREDQGEDGGVPVGNMKKGTGKVD